LAEVNLLRGTDLCSAILATGVFNRVLLASVQPSSSAVLMIGQLITLIVQGRGFASRGNILNPTSMVPELGASAHISTVHTADSPGLRLVIAEEGFEANRKYWLSIICVSVSCIVTGT
ncbi:hypothetical protein, partial [Glutamicibacter ardleyensis]|uniref:hypothetical protein n=1 Tax=Glutamicibacter ardleyensis TaxID=225894 RepID=UPI003FD320F7